MTDTPLTGGRPSPRDHLAAGGATRHVDPDELLDERQVSRLWGIPTKTLQTWRYRGEGPAYVKVGSSVRYVRRDISTWLESRTVRH